MAAPDSPTAAAPTLGRAERSALIASLDFDFERPRISFRYRVQGVVVAALIMVLPAVYFVVIAGVAGALYWHVTQNAFFRRLAGKATFFGIPVDNLTNVVLIQLMLPLWAAVLGFLALWLFFLIRPVVVRTRRVDRALDLDPQEEPFLHEFVARLCRTLDAPVPRRIRVDCGANASAGFHEGAAGVLGGRRILTIGLALAAGMSVQELAGLLAHELGHFSQRAGGRLSWAIRAVNSWFTGIILSQRMWEARLLRPRRRSLGQALCKVAGTFVGLTRRLLTALQGAALAMSASFSRQMEFNADACAARVVGSRCAEEMLARTRRLGHAWAVADGRIGRSWSEHRLVDDVPALILAEEERLPEDFTPPPSDRPIPEAVARLASHPADAEREAALRRLDAQARVTSALPASILFLHFDDLCKRVTWRAYTAFHGKRVKPGHLVSLAEFQRKAEDGQVDVEALNRFFQGCAYNIAPCVSDHVEEDARMPTEADRAEVARLRGLILAGGPEARGRLAEAAKTLGGIDRAEQAETLLRAGFTIKAATFKLPSPDLQGCRQSREEARRLIDDGCHAAKPVLDALGRRMQLDLALLPCAALEGGPEPETLRTEAARLVTAVRATTRALPVFLETAAIHGAWNVLMANAAKGDRVRRFRDLVQGTIGRIWKGLSEIRDATISIRYPFEDLGGPATIGRHLVPLLRGAKDIPTTLEAFKVLAVRLPALHARALGRLAEIAEAVEKALGLDPIPAPQPEAKPSA